MVICPPATSKLHSHVIAIEPKKTSKVTKETSMVVLFGPVLKITRILKLRYMAGLKMWHDN
jgi:hypothetical protein